MEEILEQLQASTSKMEQLDAEYKDKEEDVNAQSRRVLLLENESGINIGKKSVTHNIVDKYFSAVMLGFIYLENHCKNLKNQQYSDL